MTMREIYKTDIERKMDEALKKAKINVVHNFPIRCKYGYILDFAIPDLKIDIETDGEHWHPIGNSHDRKRNGYLKKQGWKVLRFRGKEIKKDIHTCIARINIEIKRREKKYENKSKS